MKKAKTCERKKSLDAQELTRPWHGSPPLAQPVWQTDKMAAKPLPPKEAEPDIRADVVQERLASFEDWARRPSMDALTDGIRKMKSGDMGRSAE